LEKENVIDAIVETKIMKDQDSFKLLEEKIKLQLSSISDDYSITHLILSKEYSEALAEAQKRGFLLSEWKWIKDDTIIFPYLVFKKLDEHDDI
jgi:hypothetical protein